MSKNQLLRMYGLHRLHSLVELDLSHNGILTIEGLKELTQLNHLNLAGNNIKSIEHLTTNTRLEHLNLSENSIGNLSDISNLKVLKVRIITVTVNYQVLIVLYRRTIVYISLPLTSNTIFSLLRNCYCMETGSHI